MPNLGTHGFLSCLLGHLWVWLAGFTQFTKKHHQFFIQQKKPTIQYSITCCVLLFYRGADLGVSLKSAATCVKWETKDAVKLINLCGGLLQNWDVLFEVNHCFVDRISR